MELPFLVLSFKQSRERYTSLLCGKFQFFISQLASAIGREGSGGDSLWE